MIWGMQSQEYEANAERLAPFIENFAMRSLGRCSAADIATKIKATDYQCWVVDDFKAVCLTSLGDDNVTISFCSGTDREEWQDDLEEEIAAWAKFKGVHRLFLVGRPGWSKWAKGRGYSEAHREMTRAL